MKDNNEITIFRRVFPQILAVIANGTLQFSFGLSIAFPTLVIPAFSRPDSDIVMNNDQISWLGSLFFIVIPFGCLASGPCTLRFGRKSVMIAFSLPFAAAWWFYSQANTPGELFGVVIMHGIINGLLEAPILTYVAEVCEPDWRGILSSASVLFSLAGVSLQFFIGNYLNWRKAALVNISVPLVSFISICLIPESPHWLIGRGRIEDAQKSLQWLRGWVQPEMVKKELEDLTISIQATKLKTQFSIEPYMKGSFLKPFSMVVISFMIGHFSGMSTLQTYAVQPEMVKKVLEDLTISIQATKLKTQFSIEPYMKGSFLKPFSMVVISFMIGHFSGMSTLQTYAVGIFDSIKSPVGGYEATAAEGFVQFFAALLCVCILPFIGRRSLALTTTFGTGVCLIALSIFTEGWPALILLLVSVFLINSCSKIFPWVLIGEVFSPDVRSVASGAASCIGYSLGFLVNKTYFLSVDLLSLKGVFGFYGLVSFLGALYYFLLLPETEGRSLDEVQAHFKGQLDLTKEKKKLNGNVNSAFTHV